MDYADEAYFHKIYAFCKKDENDDEEKEENKCNH